MQKATVFVRRIKQPGVYASVIGEKRIEIRDRGTYPTSDKKEIEFLKNDPEVEIFKIEDPDLDKKMYRDGEIEAPEK